MSHFLCFFSLITPTTVNKAHSISGFIKYFLKEIRTSCVCSAKSLTGSRIIASGCLLATEKLPLLLLILLLRDASSNDLIFCSLHWHTIRSRFFSTRLGISMACSRNSSPLQHLSYISQGNTRLLHLWSFSSA